MVVASAFQLKSRKADSNTATFNGERFVADFPKVDMHIHLYPTAEISRAEKEGDIWEYGGAPLHQSQRQGTLEELRGQMQANGIGRGVLLVYSRARERLAAERARMPAGLTASEAEALEIKLRRQALADMEERNLWGCELSRANPDISTFIAIDLSLQSGEEAAAHARHLAENHGAHGIKLHTGLQGFSISDERLWPLYAFCQERGMPVLGHGGPDRVGSGYSEPQAFAAMLEAFPRLTVVLAHMGGATFRQTAALAARFANLCFDCSEVIEWTGTPNGPTDLELASLIREVGTERVMMGSDFPWYDLDHTVQRIQQLPLLSDEEKRGIMGANAMRLLRL
jgi:predicted TIM-barrel fold metal-dependent hydrolase